MFFFPYRLDARINGLPILTLLICLVCCFIYWEQYSNEKQYLESIKQFCLQDLSKREIGWLQRLPQTRRGNQCALTLEAIRNSETPATRISQLVREAKPLKLYSSKKANREYLEKEIALIYDKFNQRVPIHLTSDLAYDPHDFDIVKMVTSTFSHGSALHLAGNLLFFYIFAASVEIVFGNLVFALFIGATTFGTSLAYSFVMANVENALPTVGLSGVVMAAMAALAIMLPRAEIRCFFWFLVFFRRFKLPALLIAAWYIGWDIYNFYQTAAHSYINYVAHISGAAIGASFAIYYLVFKRKRLAQARIHY